MATVEKHKTYRVCCTECFAMFVTLTAGPRECPACERKRRDTRAAIIRGLHDLADFLDRHNDLPVPSWVNAAVFLSGHQQRDELRNIRKRLGEVSKREYGSGNSMCITKKFGPINLEYIADRKQVCRQVKTGERVIPAVKAHTIPPVDVAAQPERVEDIVEWECDSILEPKEHPAMPGADPNITPDELIDGASDAST